MIFAIDFDGTIFSEGWPEIGEPVREVVKFIRELQERGDLWILYTMREGDTLEQAVAALAELGLRPDAINDNLPERCARFGNNPRKIYADIYIDDHNCIGKINRPKGHNQRRSEMNQIIKTTAAKNGGKEQNYEGLVTFHNDDPVTTSLRFAEIFGEYHDHVLQAIDKLKELEFHRLYFKPVMYSQEEGKSFKIYLISMDGFLVLSAAFPNKKAEYDIYYEAFRAARRSKNPSAGQILCTLIDIVGAEWIIERLKKCRHLELDQEIEHGKNAHD